MVVKFKRNRKNPISCKSRKRITSMKPKKGLVGDVGVMESALIRLYLRSEDVEDS